MKLSSVSLIALLQIQDSAASLRNFFSSEGDRKLAGTWYKTDYDENGYCTNEGNPVHGSRTMYDTMIACCIGSFEHEAREYCFAQMPNPPTIAPTGAPTEAGTLTVWYPDYAGTFEEGKCINMAPVPSGRITYASQALCCAKAYRGQRSRVCVSGFQDSPTASPTSSPTEAGSLDLFYPIWTGEGFCTNDHPSVHGLGTLNGRKTYSSMADCCSTEFKNQKSGACYGNMLNPPTASPTGVPTEAGSLTEFYPVYHKGDGFCTNDPPKKHGYKSLSGVQTYSLLSDCCAKNFGWQKNNHCFGAMPNPPTAAPTVEPTEEGTLTVFYPVYGGKEGFCSNDPPSMNGLGSLNGRKTFDTMAECCTYHFGFQKSSFCFSQMANPPTQSPTESPTEQGSVTVFYPIRDKGDGFCTNDPPSKHGLKSLNGKETYSTLASCCKSNFGWQKNNFCYSQMANPPTASPTEAATEPGTMTEYYPVYPGNKLKGNGKGKGASKEEGYCSNVGPAPSGLPLYKTLAECCTTNFGWQQSGFCYGEMPNPPTAAPTAEATEPGTMTEYYPVYPGNNLKGNGKGKGASKEEGYCSNVGPAPSGLPLYKTQAACCKENFGWQKSNFCFGDMPNAPTASPTEPAGLLEIFYAVREKGEGFCTNEPPEVHGKNKGLNGIQTYSSMAECCEKNFKWQKSGNCFNEMPNPPTASPTEAATEAGTLDEFYPVYPSFSAGKGKGKGGPKKEGYCSNQGPRPSGLPVYSTMAECCEKNFKWQSSSFCYGEMLAPPTPSPTEGATEGGSLSVWYPDYSSWDKGTCVNTSPLPSYAKNKNWDTQEACCAEAYNGQKSGACMAAAGLAADGASTPWYPIKAGGGAVCVNDGPLPAYAKFKNYESEEDCCYGAFNNKKEEECLANMAANAGDEK